jgi:D-cysteine desulfhydrase family pyridoxal phosphate-dependent enzyme
MSRADGLARLHSLPRAILNVGATPLHELTNLANQLDANKLWIKRDDMGPLAFGGNKLRQLEYYFGDAVSKGADCVLITGAVQSNFVRLAAAAACRLGMQCHIQLEERVAKDDLNYRNSGNVLLDRMLGATLYSYPHGEDEAGADNNLEVIADQLREKGARPYVIHLGSDHPSIGALGYVMAAVELLEQLAEQAEPVDKIVVASGSGATHSGLLFGLRLLESDIPLVGACVRRDATIQRTRIKQHLESIAKLLEMENIVSDEDIMLDDNFLAPGYGKVGPLAEEAIRLCAQSEGIIVDPVYTAKSFACFIDNARRNQKETIVYIHTGGLPAIFAYQDDMLKAIGAT